MCKWLKVVRRDGLFFIMMYALGWLCTQVEIPKDLIGAQPYELAAPELFFDLCLVCLLLALLPNRIHPFVKGFLYVVLYGVAIVDMYCYSRFESTITPTMLMLVGETNSRETSEFFASYLGWDALTPPVGYILLLLTVHVSCFGFIRFLRKRIHLPSFHLKPFLKYIPMLAVLALFVTSAILCWDNKMAVYKLMTKQSIGEVERQLNQKPRAELYLPVYRLVFSLYANHLANRQIETLVSVKDRVQIDSCTYRVPNIVLMIGESYNKHHSQLYGYDMPTTPRQLSMAKAGTLVPFTDVVAPWNLTSFVFKYLLSLHTVGDSGQWCDYPLFPEVFRKAGYHVTFITNQFLPEAGEAVYDFSGGFFLNHPELSRAQFDTRNARLHEFDEGVLQEYDSLSREDKANNLVILHFMGSHTMYKSRYPQQTRKHLRARMYNRPDLTPKQRLIVADYDNSVLYNDSIVAAVTASFAQKDAVVIYLADHAEEIYNGPLYIYGRMHSAVVDYRLAREEFEIPFWIWGSPQFIEHHPDDWRAICASKDRPFMTDRLAHLLLYLGGIHTKDYQETYNVIHPRYDARRPRLLKGQTDYDALRHDAKKHTDHEE